MNGRPDFRLVVLAAILVLPGCAGEGAGPSTAVCAPFHRAAVSAIPQTWEALEGEPFERIWKSWAAGNAQDPSWRPGKAASFRLHTSHSYGVGPQGAFDLRGARMKGRWRIEARSNPMLDQTSAWSPWRPVEVSAATGRRIDELLADPCFWNTPRFLPARLPLVDGGEAERHHGPVTFFDVRQAGRRWGGIQDSWVLGPPGGLRFVAMKAAYDDPWRIDTEIADLSVEP